MGKSCRTTMRLIRHSLRLAAPSATAVLAAACALLAQPVGDPLLRRFPLRTAGQIGPERIGWGNRGTSGTVSVWDFRYGERMKAGTAMRAAAAGCLRTAAGHRASAECGLRIALMPRCQYATYSASCREGALEAARELDADLVWDAPSEPDPAAQERILRHWLDRRVDVIAVAASDPYRASPLLRKAQARGIPVVAWDVDTEPDSRDIFVNPIDANLASRILADAAASMLRGRGDIAVLAGRCDCAFESFRTGLLEKRPAANLSPVRFGNDDWERAFCFTRDVLRCCSSVKLVVSLLPMSIRGAAAGVALSGRDRIKVIGVGLPPSGSRHPGSVTPLTIYWSPRDLGYLTVYVAAFLARRTSDHGAPSVLAGRLGTRDLRGHEIVLGQPVIAT
jgi:rhamnose transport system substrate-binding protein